MRDDAGQIVGGAHGWTAFGWLHVDVLWLREDLRSNGLGRQLLQATEAEAKRRGCKFAKLETFMLRQIVFSAGMPNLDKTALGRSLDPAQSPWNHAQSLYRIDGRNGGPSRLRR